MLKIKFKKVEKNMKYCIDTYRSTMDHKNNKNFSNKLSKSNLQQIPKKIKASFLESLSSKKNTINYTLGLKKTNRHLPLLTLKIQISALSDIVWDNKNLE